MEAAELGRTGLVDYPRQTDGGEWRPAQDGIQTLGFLTLLRAIDNFERIYILRKKRLKVSPVSQHNSFGA